jgi:hypothetical protein
MARICAAEAGGRTEGWPKKRTRLKMDRIFGPSCLLFGVPETDYPAGSLPRRQRRFPLAHGTVYPPQVRFHAPRVHRHLPCVPCDAPQVPRNVPHVHRHRTTGTAPPARSPPRICPRQDDRPPPDNPGASELPDLAGEFLAWLVQLQDWVVKLQDWVVQSSALPLHPRARVGKSPSPQKNREKRYIKTVNKLGG